MEGQDEVSAREQHFHSQVRESTICFLLFAILYVVSYFIITRYKRKSDEQEDEDAIVNRISFVESCFPFFQPLFICIDALCLFLSGIRRLCWPEKGNPSPHFRDFGHASSSCVTHSWDSVGSFSTH